MKHVAIVGGGIAGTAAAWSAAKAGAKVTLIHAGLGASHFTSGALDLIPWESSVRAARLLKTSVPLAALDAREFEFANALQLWSLPPNADTCPMLATIAGRIRPARGFDRALLDLSTLQRGTVLVPRCDRPNWDADALAAYFSDDPVAKARDLQFVATDATILRNTWDAGLSDTDLAGLHDDDGRLDWLATQLRTACDRASTQRTVAVLLGPWLGARQPRAARLSERVGIPVGEALCGNGSPAGRRLEIAMNRVVSDLRVSVLRERASVIAVDESGVRVTLESEAIVEADALVIAAGGMIPGSVELVAPIDMTPRPQAKVGFALSFRFDGALSQNGTTPLENVSSCFGSELDAAWPERDRLGMLEAIGIHATDVHVSDRIKVAGDILSCRPRVILAAVRTGLQAGAHAAAVTPG